MDGGDPQNSKQLLNMNYAEEKIAIDYKRKSEKLRQNISQKWLQTSDWANVISTMNATTPLPEYKEGYDTVKQWVDAVNSVPSPTNVNSLQSILNMENSDNSAGRDGIL